MHSYIKTILISIFYVCACSISAQAQVALYGSKQTGQFSQTGGQVSKATDAYEKGNVTISSTGPVKYEVTPAALGINPNENKTWKGKIYPDMDNLPAAGTSAQAALTGSFDISYSRPAGTGTSGTVVSTYECGEKGCPYHKGVKGVHEIVNETGQKKYEFVVYSVACNMPATTYLCYNGPATVTATGYPTGGTYKWQTASKNIKLKNEDSATVTVIFKGPDRGEENLKCTYTINGVSYEATGVVNTALPQQVTLNRAANFFDADDRTHMARCIGLQYVVQCLKVWSYFFEYDYDFEHAGGIVASDPDIKQQMDNWYQAKAAQLVSSGKQVKIFNETFKWRTDENTLLGFALGTSEYKVSGSAKIECKRNGDFAVKFDVLWTVSDEIDWNSYNDVKKNYNGAWHWGFLPENILDLIGDKIFDGEYNFITTYEEKVYVDYKK